MLRIFTLITLLFANTSFAETVFSTELRFRCEIKKLEMLGYDNDLRRVKVGNIVPFKILLETNADKNHPQATVKLGTKTIQLYQTDWGSQFLGGTEIGYIKKNNWLSASVMNGGRYSQINLSPNFLQITNSYLGSEIAKIKPNQNNFIVKFAETFEYHMEAECPEPMPQFELLKATIEFEDFFSKARLKCSAVQLGLLSPRSTGKVIDECA